MSSKDIGAQAEEQALQYLQQQGLAVVSRNYHCRRGEIDLIMIDDNTLAFIEVRYRKSATFGGALESVNHTKQKRIIHTAQHYLQQQQTPSHNSYRFDVVAISPNQHAPEITWIKDAFQLN
ncbi:YraN family protein [Methylophaga sp. 42_25_T18]|nr:YraN family protein [Methylophaga sp. 42_25_T18]OUR87830.1 YraN family protein [Methylophaga sp. 42_8_T64]